MNQFYIIYYPGGLCGIWGAINMIVFLFLKIEIKVRVLIENIGYLKFYKVRYPGGPIIKSY